MNQPLLALIETALVAEFGPKARVAALATADPAGGPHVRHVVVRRLDAAGLWITADTRSAKAEHLRDRPRAELAFWLPSVREQFRLAGPVHVVADRHSADGETIWREMPDASRALFFWPGPGSPRERDASRFPAAVPSDTPIPETFLLLCLAPDVVERLELSPHPHRRSRWRRDRAWDGEELNP